MRDVKTRIIRIIHVYMHVHVHVGQKENIIVYIHMYLLETIAVDQPMHCYLVSQKLLSDIVHWPQVSRMVLDVKR